MKITEEQKKILEKAKADLERITSELEMLQKTDRQFTYSYNACFEAKLTVGEALQDSVVE